MYASPGVAGYDRASILFSPQGYLFQVQYADEAVKQGSLAIGLTYKDGILFGAKKQAESRLIVPESLHKIYVVEEHIAIAYSGLVADARRLVQVCRDEAEQYRLVYGKEIPVDVLNKRIAEIVQSYTQYGGVRPFGVALLVGGVSDKKIKLSEIPTSGAMLEYLATAIGSGADKVKAYFESAYKTNMNRDEAISFLISSMKEAAGKSDKKFSPTQLEIAILERKQGFKRLTESEIKAYL